MSGCALRQRNIQIRLLDLYVTWKSVVSFTSHPLYPLGEIPGSHCIGRVGPKAGLTLGLGTPFPWSAARSQSLYRLRYAVSPSTA
jgi:hypothetical protein